MSARVILVQGLAYGDEGKGTTVDYLTREYNASLVVRFNGGAQAAHNVVTSYGQEHTFAQFGSGTLAGARTYLSEAMIVNPLYALNEGHHLDELLGYDPFTRLFVNEDAMVTTPYHVAANRLKELLRGLPNRHGSCGMGIGETMEDWHYRGSRRDYVVTVKNLVDGSAPMIMRRIQKHRLAKLEKRAEKLLDTPLCEQVKPALKMLRLSPDFHESRYQEFIDRAHIVNHDFLASALDGSETVIFEGAQGVLLDQDYGFQPYTTWTRCTWENANRLLQGFRGERQYLGVIRTYMTRHGHGPFVTEEDYRVISNVVNDVDHNKANLWQRHLRCGHFDPVALRYAIGVLGRVDGIVLTHMDTLRKLDRSVKVCKEYGWTNEFLPYAGDGYFTVRDDASSRIDVPLELPSFERQCRVSYYLDKAIPVYEDDSLDPDLVVKRIKRRLGVPVLITSQGPTAEDKLGMENVC